MTRNRLPQRRYSETFDVKFAGKPVTVTVGCNEEGSIGEVFLNAQKMAGSDIDLAARDVAILISIALQYGAPMQVMADALTKDAEGRPEGLAGIVLTRLTQSGGAA